jgi:hypothetical protein
LAVVDTFALCPASGANADHWRAPLSLL